MHYHVEISTNVSTLCVTIEKIKLNTFANEKKIVELFPTATGHNIKISRKHHKKRSQCLSTEQVRKFIFDWSINMNRTLLCRKVFMILCHIYGLSFQTIRLILMEDLVRNKDMQLCINLKKFEADEIQNSEKLIIDQEDYANIISKYFDIIYEDTGKKTGYFLRTVHGFKFTEKRMGLNAMFAAGVDVARHLQLDNPEIYGSAASGRKLKIPDQQKKYIYNESATTGTYI